MKIKSRKPKLRLYTNHAPQRPFSAPSFDAWVSQCMTELSPAIDRVCKRHPLPIVLAALLAEIEDATIQCAVERTVVDPRVIDHIHERLQTTIRRVSEVRGDPPQSEPHGTGA